MAEPPFTAGWDDGFGAASALEASKCGSVKPTADNPPAHSIVRRDIGVAQFSIELCRFLDVPARAGLFTAGPIDMLIVDVSVNRRYDRATIFL